MVRINLIFYRIFCGSQILSNVEYVWLVDLSNLLMNSDTLVMPIVCFIFTRGFRDLFFVIRRGPINFGVLEVSTPLCCDGEPSTDSPVKTYV